MSWRDWFTASPGQPVALGWGSTPDPSWQNAGANAFEAPDEFDRVREGLPPDHPLFTPPAQRAGRAVDYNFPEGKGDRLDIKPNIEGVAPLSGWELEQPRTAQLAREGKRLDAPSLIERINPSLEYEKDLNTTVAPKGAEPFALNPVVRGTVIDAEWEPMTGERRNAPSQLRRGLQALPEALKATNVGPMLGMMGEGALDSAARAITAPVRAMEGEIHPDDMFEEAWNTTLNVGGWGGVAQGAAGAAGKKLATGDLGVFAGSKARTANFDKLARARNMERTGADASDIWEQTGWGRAADGRWRFEIDDSKANLSNDARIMLMTGNKMKAGDANVFDHPELYDAYPQLKEMPLGSLPPGSGLNGQLGPDGIRVDPTRPISDVQSTMLHELQHGVQEMEGFGRGGNTGEFRREADTLINFINNRLSGIAKQIDEVSRTGKVGPNGSALKELRGEYDRLMDMKLNKVVPQAQDPHSSYRRLAGEVESRNTQHREKWDAQKRSDVPPVFSEDVPRGEQDVRFDRGKKSAEEIKPAPLGLVPALRRGDEVLTGGANHGEVAAKHNYFPDSRDDSGFAIDGVFHPRDTALDIVKAAEPGTAANLTKARMGKLEANDLRRAREVSEGTYPTSPPLKGMPTTAEVPGFGSLAVGPNPAARAAAESYMKKAGMPYNPQREYVPVDPQRAARVADEFERMPHNPNDPEVATSYKALIDETKAQFDEMPKDLKIEFIKPGMKDPYAASPRLVQKDIAENNHMWVYPTESGFGKEGFDPKGNPMLERSGVSVDGRELANNDLFRIVHDYFGHAKEGVGFRATGEDNAFRQHRSMFSPAAQRALTTETRGQNSWLNYGPQGAKNRTAKTEDTTFADQKVGLMPQWTTLYANSKKAAPLSMAASLENDFPFDNPNAKPVGKAVDDPMSYTNKGGMPLKSPQLPLGFTGSFDATKNAPFTMGGRHPHEWSPEEFKQVGDAFGVDRLGPLSPEVEFPYLERGSFDIPGGLEGKFTYLDMLAMKTHPINPERIDPALHAQIQKKMTRSMMPDEGDVSQSHMLSGLNFGMTSPGNPLFSNQLAMSRLRVNSVEDLDRLANSVPWKFGDDVSKEMRHKHNIDIAKKYGIGAADADGGGGLGVRGNADYTRVAEMAQMFKKEPEWFRKRPDEQWSHFAERVFTQVPGMAAKTGSFGVVWQSPVDAAVSAIDRHMSKIFKDKFLDTPEKKAAWENRVLALYNKKRVAKGEEPMQDISELSDNDLGYELLQELGKTKKSNFRTPKGEIGKGVPEHMRDEKWIMEPKQATVMGTAYKKALQANADEASKAGLGLFESQWHLWDRIRRRLEPHENMFPGLEKLPRMSVDQLKRVDRTHMLSGHKDQTKLKVEDGSVRLKPTKLMENPADFAYFSNPAAAAPFGAIPAARRDERPQGR